MGIHLFITLKILCAYIFIFVLLVENHQYYYLHLECQRYLESGLCHILVRILSRSHQRKQNFYMKYLHTDTKDLYLVETHEWMKSLYIFDESGWKVVTDWGDNIWKGDRDSDM